MVEWYDITQLTERYGEINNKDELIRTCQEDLITLEDKDFNRMHPDAVRAASFVGKTIFYLRHWTRPGFVEDIDFAHIQLICDRFKG